MIVKVTSINLERDQLHLAGGDMDESAWMVRRLSRWPNVRLDDEFVVTIQPAKDVKDWPEEKGGDDEC